MEHLTMPPKPTPNPRAEAARDRDAVLVEMFAYA